MLSERKLQIRLEGENSIKLTQKVTLTEEAVMHVNIKGFAKETVDQINESRLHKKVFCRRTSRSESEIKN